VVAQEATQAQRLIKGEDRVQNEKHFTVAKIDKFGI
jgi:hypothetical protein